MKTYFSAILIVLVANSASNTMAAESTSFYIPEVRTDVTDIDSLRRGTSIFFANCIACHSLKFMRYQRISDDLGISKEDMLADGILPKDTKMTDAVLTALTDESALTTYGIVPPDLSLKTREKGTAWLHGFLTTFYEDSASRTGVNNAFFPGTAMPHLLAGKQGVLKPIYQEIDGKKTLVSLEQKIPGSLSQKEFYNEMRDLTAFLEYVAEPSKIQRLNIGIYILLFLFGLLILTYLLKRELWKNVH